MYHINTVTHLSEIFTQFDHRRVDVDVFACAAEGADQPREIVLSRAEVHDELAGETVRLETVREEIFEDAAEVAVGGARLGDVRPACFAYDFNRLGIVERHDRES